MNTTTTGSMAGSTRLRAGLAGALAAAALAITAAPAQAAADATVQVTGGAAYADGTVYVTGQLAFTATQDDGQGRDNVYLEVYDDGQARYLKSFSLPLGERGSFVFHATYQGGIRDAFPGIAVALSDEPDGLFIAEDEPLFGSANYIPFYQSRSDCRVNCADPIAAAVPEPSTLWLWALSALGLGALAYGTRRNPLR